ncbi:ThiF family adenylyltransferase [Aurantimonas sp. E1-2-R+4]|uniref:ThiF family adenylyltransferase n=1 Tax=Aurantimonas sp. E1-2-R+4 TaxID=3113714 RepID=UPI002F94BCE4
MHDALVGRGFHRVPRGGRDIYKGTLDIASGEVPVTLLVPDLDFLTMPLIRIAESWVGPNRRLPHLGPTRLVCYYAQGSVILDRYDPGGTVIQCIECAERVLDAAVAGRSDADFGAEFDVYWSSRWMLSDLPSGYSGPAAITYPRLSADNEPTPVLVAGQSWTRERDPPRRADGFEETALVVSLAAPLTIDPERTWPPADYGQLVDWLRWTDPELPRRLDEALATGTHHQATLAIRATNGVFACRIGVPEPMRTPEFLVNRRPTLARNLRRATGEVAVERITADAANLDYVYGRNLGSRGGLVGRSVAVIGCGTIGGFLAQQLAQCGAGIDGGRLLLVDTDDLRTANLGRHLLGVPFLHRNKAAACATFLNAMLPGAKVEWSNKDALDLPELGRFDLVVDATGEEALSIALNQAAVNRRPSGPAHLFVWLMGNGIAAQCLLVDEDADMACLKCLKPELAGEPRFPVLRPGVETEIGRVEACADADFVTFPVSRSVVAAALACDLALDWASGSPGHRYRSHTFEPDKAFEVADSNPQATDRCPACATNR